MECFLVQAIAHFLLFAAVNMVGIFYNYLGDIAHRKAFSETQRYTLSLTQMEEQKEKKVMLALAHSCLTSSSSATHSNTSSAPSSPLPWSMS